MNNHFNSLDEVIITSIEEAFMNARDKFPVVLVEDDICKKIINHSFASKSVCVRKKKEQKRIKEVPTSIPKPITCYLLVKIGKKEYMERLLKSGGSLYELYKVFSRSRECRNWRYLRRFTIYRKWACC